MGHVTVIEKNEKKGVLFLRKWLRNGVNNINEHSFIDGVLDVDYVCCKVVYSNNIWSEICLAKNALLP